MFKYLYCDLRPGVFFRRVCVCFTVSAENERTTPAELFYYRVMLQGQGHAMVVTTQLRDNEVYYVVYKLVCYLVFRAVGPLVALLVLNVFSLTPTTRVPRRETR